jgi:hypothetical protein
MHKNAAPAAAAARNNSGEGWWIVLSVIDVGEISCTR